jgi:3-oxoadipate enol-lactonase
MDLREALPRIAAPTLVVSGSDDAATPVEQQRLIAQSVPAARHEIVGPAAHIAAVEQADAVNRLIEAHLS